MPDFRDAAFEAIRQILKMDSRITVLTNDMGAVGLDSLREEYPTHVINMGIAEQNLMSVAAGLSLTGRVVFVYGITSHMTLRCIEQFRLDVCAMNLPVILLGVGSGLAYGADGPTHHAVNDLGAMGSIPGLTILNPADAFSASHLVRWAYARKAPAYVRLDKDAHQPLYESSSFDGHQGFSVLCSGSDLAIVSTGIMVHRAIQVADVLESEGIHASVLDVFRLTPMNVEGICQTLQKVSLVVSLEEHAGPGGLGTRLAEMVVDHQLSIRLHRLMLPETFFMGAATRKWVHEQYGLSTEKIFRAVQGFIESFRFSDSRALVAMTGRGDA
jgi:transketolase